MAMLRASRFIRSSGSSEQNRDLSRSDSRRARRGHRSRRRCGESTAAWCGRSSREEATTARRCSSTTAAPETPRTRRFRPVSPARRRAPRSPSIAPRPFTGTRWRCHRPPPARSAWREGLATALANAGRPADAAEAYLRAAADAGDLQRVELQRRGAEQFLIGGHIDRGLELIRTMLANMGMAVPRSPRAALLPLLWRRARLRWRGSALRVEGCRRHRCRYAPAPGHLLVGDDGTVARRHDQRGRVQRPSPAPRTRCRRTVPSVARDGDRVGRAGRLSERSQAQSTLVQLSKELAKGVGDPHAIGLSRLADGMMAMARWRMEKGVDARRGGAGDPAGPVRRGHVGIEHGPEPRDLGPHVSGRARRVVAPAAGAPGQRAQQREPVHRHRVVHAKQLLLAGGRRSRRRGACHDREHRAMVAQGVSSSALQRDAGPYPDRALSWQR